MNKKSVLLTILFLTSIFSFVVPVNAQAIDFQQPMNEAIQMFQDFFGPIFEVILGVSQFDETFFSFVLLSILLTIMIYTILVKIDLFQTKHGVAFIIAVIVSVLGLRFIPLEYITGIMLPYGVTGIAIAAGLPFIVYFFFVHYSIASSTGRRAAWIFFAAIFFGLWFQRRNDIGDFGWIYGIAIAGVVISILADPKIHEYFGLAEAREAKRKRIELQITNLETSLSGFRTNNPNPSPTAKRTMDRLEQQINNLYRKL